jgi:DMSO/TMAO reductase YedYZ molybdopterin-dependent catalytic subunit
VTATIQCAGNRRNEMTAVKPVKGGFWDIGAIGNAEWSGVRLRDVLLAAGVDEAGAQQLKHVQFEGLDRDMEKNYAASIPIDKVRASVTARRVVCAVDGDDGDGGRWGRRWRRMEMCCWRWR